ncbi:hypothetical protein VBZ51_02225 [Maribacter sp. HS]|uniref:hypothetical protein n=1 Tax=Maribacter sp. HS TaxID=3110480 RepID=UPI003A8C8816
MLKLRVFYRIIFSFLFCTWISCDNDSTEGMIEQEMISKPVISISEDLSYIEIETNFLIKIESDYNVQTELSIDNQELISSTEKSFEFTIDPFLYNIGNHILKIKSTDAQNQETSFNVNIEIKKLLFEDQTFYQKENPLQGLRYISVHDQSGILIDIKQIEGINDGKFYADNNFIKEDLIVTRYELPTLFNGFYQLLSFVDVKPGTVVNADHNFNSPYFFPKTESLNFTSEITPALIANNFNSTIVSQDNSDYVLLYSLAQTKNFLITTSTDNLDTLDNFKYFFIDDINKTEYVLGDSKSLTNIEELEIPVSSNFRLNLYGFIDNNDFQNNKFYEAFVSRNANNNIIEIPLIDEFEINQARLSYSENNSEIFINQDISNKIIESPNANILQDGNTLNTSGEYDYLGLNLILTTSDLSNTVSWSIITSEKDNIDILHKTIEIPEIIHETLLNVGINMNVNETSDQGKFLTCTLYKNYDYTFNHNQLITQPNYSSNRDGFSFKKTLSFN